ncbi:MAG TPA: hypothetical protein VFT80_06625 [Actinomycetota bacterium]|nr:hypothetical protein [Actinomycetota bacterium]
MIVDPYVSNAVRLPVAPLQVPSADITVAAIPAPPAMSFKIAWNSAAARSETGSSPMSANAAVGKCSAAALGEAEATGAAEGSSETVLSAGFEVDVHAPRATTRRTVEIRP